MEKNDGELSPHSKRKKMWQDKEAREEERLRGLARAIAKSPERLGHLYLKYPQLGKWQPPVAQDQQPLSKDSTPTSGSNPNQTAFLKATNSLPVSEPSAKRQYAAAASSGLPSVSAAATSPSMTKTAFLKANKSLPATSSSDAMETDGAAPEALQEEPRQDQPTTGKTPAIFADYTPEWPTHSQAIGELCGGEVEATCRGNNIRLKPKSPEEFRIIQRYLIGAKVPFHTFTLRRMRPLKVVFRGLPSDVDSSQIVSALRSEGFVADEAFRLKTARGVTNLWVVTLSAEEEDRPPSEINELQRLLHLRVTVTTYRKRKGPAQCWRCQGFGHGSYNCCRPERCVRCGGEHGVSQCPKPKGETGECCHCNGSHNASYRGCPAWKEASRAPVAATNKKAKTAFSKATTAKRQISDPETEDAPTTEADEDDGFETVRKRRKRQPRKPENRGPRPERPAQPPRKKTREDRPTAPPVQRQTPRQRIDWPPQKPVESTATKKSEEAAPAEQLKAVLQQLTELVRMLGALIPLLQAGSEDEKNALNTKA